MNYSAALKKTKEKLDDCLEEDREYYEQILYLLNNPPIRKNKIRTKVKTDMMNLERSLQYNITKLQELRKNV